MNLRMVYVQVRLLNMEVEPPTVESHITLHFRVNGEKIVRNCINGESPMSSDVPCPVVS
jgi:hypothetical protein